MHQIEVNWSWLKIRLGKMDTERRVPLDAELLALLERITQLRSPGRALTNPRYHRPSQFHSTHHARRMAQNSVRECSTPISASTAPATAPTPPHCRSRPHNESTSRPSPKTHSGEDESAGSNATTS